MRAPRILLIDDDPNDKGVRNGAVYLPKPFPLAALDRVVQIVLTDRQLLAESSPDKFEEEHFLETSPIMLTAPSNLSEREFGRRKHSVACFHESHR